MDCTIAQAAESDVEHHVAVAGREAAELRILQTQLHGERASAESQRAVLDTERADLKVRSPDTQVLFLRQTYIYQRHAATASFQYESMLVGLGIVA